MAKEISMKIAGHEILDHEVFAVSQIRYKKDGKPLECNTATGFFYKHKGQLYFITNRHAVFDVEDCFFPDELILSLHKKIGISGDFSINLRDSNHEKLWLEHLQYQYVDIAVIRVDEEKIKEKGFHVEAFSRDYDLPGNRYISIGDYLLVVGYPLGIHDGKHNTPIIRSAIMASVYPLPFDGKPYFLIDSCLHEGTSGSPVLLQPTTVIRYTNGRAEVVMDRKESFKRYLLGIHCADWDKYNQTNLNFVWYAKLITEIIEGNQDE